MRVPEATVYQRALGQQGWFLRERSDLASLLLSQQSLIVMTHFGLEVSSLRNRWETGCRPVPPGGVLTGWNKQTLQMFPGSKDKKLSEPFWKVGLELVIKSSRVGRVQRAGSLPQDLKKAAVLLAHSNIKLLTLSRNFTFSAASRNHLCFC